MWTGSDPVDINEVPPSGWWAQFVFTNRIGGTSKAPFDGLNLADHVGDRAEIVAKNRSHLAELIASPSHGTAFIRAEHGAKSHSVMDPQLPVPLADILVTSQEEIGLVALSADCAPVLLADVTHGVVGAVHCGWRGLVENTVASALAEMNEHGATNPTTQAWVGPTICHNCYGVSDDRMREVQQVVPAAACATVSGGPAVDVRAGILHQLREAGVRVRTVGGCTYEDPNLYSHRRDGRTGRQGGAIVLRRGRRSSGRR